MSPTFTQGDQRAGFLDSATGLPPVEVTLAALSGAWPVAAADPGRRYPAARSARRVLDQARATVARTLAVGVDGVFFAPDRATAIGWALTGRLDSHPRLAVSAVEDLDVLRAADLLAASGTEVSTIGVTATGRVDVAAVAQTASQGGATTLVVQDGNVEIGTRQDLSAVRAAAPDQFLVSDLQAVLGRDGPAAGWDVGFADARMWGGPPGVVVVSVADPARWRPRVAATEGHGHVESGFPPVPLIAAAALALEATDVAAWRATAGTSAYLRQRVTEEVPDVVLLGDPDHRVSYLTMMSILYVAADELVDGLSRRGWAVASGASCTSDTRRPHHVLVAIGALTHGSLRVSLTPDTSPADIDAFVSDLAAVVATCRTAAGADGL